MPTSYPLDSDHYTTCLINSSQRMHRCVNVGGLLLSAYYTLYYSSVVVIAFEPVIPSRQSYIATENLSQKCMIEGYISFFILQLFHL